MKSICNIRISMFSVAGQADSINGQGETLGSALVTCGKPMTCMRGLGLFQAAMS